MLLGVENCKMDMVVLGDGMLEEVAEERGSDEEVKNSFLLIFLTFHRFALNSGPYVNSKLK